MLILIFFILLYLLNLLCLQILGNMFQLKSLLKRLIFHIKIFYPQETITHMTEAFRKTIFQEIFDCFYAFEK
mgnify:CR=1 FL=1